MTPDLSTILDIDARLRAACAAEIFDSFRPTTPEAFAQALGCADDLVAWIKSGNAPTVTEDRQGDNPGRSPAVAANQAPSAEEPERTPAPERQSASAPEHGAVNAAGRLAASGEAGTISPRAGRGPIPDALIVHARARIEAGESYSAVARSIGYTPEALMARAKKGGWNVGRRRAPKGETKPRPAPRLTRKQCVEALRERGIKFKTGWDEAAGETTWTIDGKAHGLAELQAFVGGLS